jgi:hypothetical protein
MRPLKLHCNQGHSHDFVQGSAATITRQDLSLLRTLYQRFDC